MKLVKLSLDHGKIWSDGSAASAFENINQSGGLAPTNECVHWYVAQPSIL